AIVASLVNAEVLIILSDIDGLYSDDPHKNQDAEIISVVDKIDEAIENIAGGAGSSLGSGGMATKIQAARIATTAGVDMIIMNGRNPEDLYKLFDGEQIGTYFPAIKNN
ncbi:MAG: glutamate 5-kinase, partial [Oscillospiraceae bacterium]|nr:glutamate 5-kinase [Oscillospiraceae bacterium]